MNNEAFSVSFDTHTFTSKALLFTTYTFSYADY